MKKTGYILLFALIILSCTRYDDYIYDYDYTSVYFPHQELKRSFVYGEFDAIKVAVQIGGCRMNANDEWVSYEVDPSLLDTTYSLLPTTHYNLSDDSKFSIPSGKMGGELVLQVTDQFFAEKDIQKFALPLRLIDKSVDTILTEKKTMVLTFNVEAAKFGNYYHNGLIIKKNAGVEVERIAYHQEEPVTKDVNNWELTSLAKDTLMSNGVGDMKSAASVYAINLVINANNSVDVFTNAASSISITDESNSSYNEELKEFYLNYSYTDGNGNDCYISDTLIFRNRMLDGVNQWNQ